MYVDIQGHDVAGRHAAPRDPLDDDEAGQLGLRVFDDPAVTIGLSEVIPQFGPGVGNFRGKAQLVELIQPRQVASLKAANHV